MFQLDIEDYNATATYLKSISPIMTGVEGRINFKPQNTVKKDKPVVSKAAHICTWNYHLILLILSTLLYFNC